MKKITIVCDNNKQNPKLETTWGFACFIEGFDKRILFDTDSEGSVLLGNMEILGIEPNSIDDVVLSHNHWDHTGGLQALIEKNPDVSVYLLPSFSSDIKSIGKKTIEVSESIELTKNILSTGELKGEMNEQSLILKIENGLCAITGCAHPGILEILEWIQDKFNEEIYMALGGFHLFRKTDSQIREIVKRIKELGVKKVGPCHCTGEKAQMIFKEVYGENYINISSGSEIII